MFLFFQLLLFFIFCVLASKRVMHKIENKKELFYAIIIFGLIAYVASWLLAGLLYGIVKLGQWFMPFVR